MLVASNKMLVLTLSNEYKCLNNGHCKIVQHNHCINPFYRNDDDNVSNNLYGMQSLAYD